MKGNFGLSGYTLPLSPKGNSTLVTPPPWFFGGDLIEVAFRVDIDTFRKFLPAPFELSNQPGLMSVVIVDMTSVSDQNAMFEVPERSQFRECIFKMHCMINGKEGWYVPVTWVNNDFTLMRGFIQGFGKKLAQIHISKLHDLNPAILGVREGAKIRAICEAFQGIKVDIGLDLKYTTTEDRYAGNGMFVMRHFPDIEDPSKLVVHEISELVVRQARKADIWECAGSISIEPTKNEEFSQLQPFEIISGRYFKEGFELVGGKVLYRYKPS